MINESVRFIVEQLVTDKIKPYSDAWWAVVKYDANYEQGTSDLAKNTAPTLMLSKNNDYYVSSNKDEQQKLLDIGYKKIGIVDPYNLPMPKKLKADELTDTENWWMDEDGNFYQAKNWCHDTILQILKIRTREAEQRGWLRYSNGAFNNIGKIEPNQSQIDSLYELGIKPSPASGSWQF